MRLVEVSFEVGNKVGGIYTVLRSKAPLMVSHFHDYLLVGYYDERKSPPEFEEETPPDTLAEIFSSIPGVEFHYGTWLVPGKPKAVLVRPRELWERKNEIKYLYWEWYHIDSLRSDGWFDTPIVWSFAVGQFLHKLLANRTDTAVLFHEWLSGGALLYLRKHAPHIPTIFHTHATMLGRTLANAGWDLYGLLERGGANPDELAYKYVLEAKHLTEKASAQNAHVFTTVSEITAAECAYILGRRPDLVLPNGLDMERIPPIEELAVMHTENEKALNDFVRAYFSPYYNIDVSNTLYFFFSGRYDVRVKGIDVLIDALALLNERMKKEGMLKNVVFFFWVARSDYPLNPEVIENVAAFRSIVEYVDKYVPALRERILDDIAEGKIPGADVLPEEFVYGARKIIYGFKGKRGKLPPISTHVPSPDDFVFRRLREVGLVNREEDPVKVIYYPAYLSPGDGLIGLSYMDAVTGTHLGVFPSYYEPWGYTPLETAAHGVPAITTDVSGFGTFIKSLYGEFCRRSGIMVLPRRNVDDGTFARELADAMYWVLSMPRRERLEKKIEAKHMAKNADWGRLIEKYVLAVQLALQRASSAQ